MGFAGIRHLHILYGGEMRALICAVAMGLLTVASPGASAEDPALSVLIEKLVQKRIITREDAREIEQELRKSAADRAPTATEPLQEAGAVAAKPPPEDRPKPKLPFEIKLRAQARLDFGDLLVGPGGGYRTEEDLFLRRVRLELDKKFKDPPFGKELDLNLTLEADRIDQDLRNGRRRDPGTDVGLQYLYADWIFADAFGLEVGRHKLPFLRAELTSSTRQLLIERPAVTGAAKDIFGDYHQTQIMAHGDVAGGALRYYFSYADGAANLGALQELDGAATAVQGDGLGKAFIARVELAPYGFREGSPFTEKRKDDSGIAAENHLTLGIDGGLQRDVRYETSAVPDARLDTSLFSADLAGRYAIGAYGTLTGQAEYINFERGFNYRRHESPRGGYFQAGYLLPWTLFSGRLEPVLRFELFDHDRIENEGESGSKERTTSIGANHYLVKHSVKWAYNFVHTRFDRGVAETTGSRNRYLHQLLMQLYF